MKFLICVFVSLAAVGIVSVLDLATSPWRFVIYAAFVIGGGLWALSTPSASVRE